MRKTALAIALILSLSGAFAGDVANFVNLGFSADGSRFVFGQYGVTDADFRGYADIWCVEVAKNAFLQGGVFSSPPSSATAGRDGSGVFAALQNKAASFLAKNGIDSSRTGRSLYVQTGENAPGSALSFRDFERGTAYAVALTERSEGSGASVRSAFYLTVTVTSKDGSSAKYTVGLPGYLREGVKGYGIRRVLIDDTGKSLAFIIEKRVSSPRGDSVRFMVETLRL